MTSTPSTNGNGLECRSTEEGVEVSTAGTGAWAIRLSPTTAPATASGRVIASSVSAVGALAQALAPVSATLSMAANSGQSMQLVFSAATQSALNSGAMSLMGGIRPMAVDAAGRIREVGIVTSGAAIAGPALLPIILPAAAASAAAYYQHQVLQATLDGIRDVVDRIEERLRQDDWAILETGDDLARSIVQDDANWDVPDQLRMELAVARQSVERVSRSRRRFAQRLIAQLEAEIQGRPDPWTDQVRKLVKGDHNWIEISIYLQAMVVRARLTAATAFVLATDGAARASTAMNASAVNELQKSYDPLLRALKPLADRRPDDKLFDRVPGRATGEDQFRFVGSLVTEMQSGIGSAFKGLDNDTTLVIPAHTVKALSAHVGEHPEG